MMLAGCAHTRLASKRAVPAPTSLRGGLCPHPPRFAHIQSVFFARRALEYYFVFGRLFCILYPYSSGGGPLNTGFGRVICKAASNRREARKGQGMKSLAGFGAAPQAGFGTAVPTYPQRAYSTGISPVFFHFNGYLSHSSWRMRKNQTPGAKCPKKMRRIPLTTRVESDNISIAIKLHPERRRE